MTDLNRRDLLAGAAAVGAAAVLSPLGASTASAAAPAAGAQAPGYYRYKVGSFECTSINDGARTFPIPDKFITNAPNVVAAMHVPPTSCLRSAPARKNMTPAVATMSNAVEKSGSNTINPAMPPMSTPNGKRP